jgi:hypothetical protein
MCLVRERSQKPLQTIRQRIPANLNATVPTGVMPGTAFEADVWYQNAGEKQPAPSRSRRPTPAAGEYAERVRDAEGDGLHEVHGHTCEGAGAALRMSLRTLRGVHKPGLHRYGATYDAMVNTKRVTPQLIQRLCIRNL